LEQLLHQVAIKKLIARNRAAEQEARQETLLKNDEQVQSKKEDQGLDPINSDSPDKMNGPKDVNDTKVRFPI